MSQNYQIHGNPTYETSFAIVIGDAVADEEEEREEKEKPEEENRRKLIKSKVHAAQGSREEKEERVSSPRELNVLSPEV